LLNFGTLNSHGTLKVVANLSIDVRKRYVIERVFLLKCSRSAMKSSNIFNTDVSQFHLPNVGEDAFG